MRKRGRTPGIDVCVVCELPLEVYDRSGKRVPHRCPEKVLKLYEEAERLSDLLDDPEGPTLEELFPDPEALKIFHAYGLLSEYP